MSTPAASAPTRFVVASYGPKHRGMLLTHLHSLACSHPRSAVSVYWQDLPQPFMDAMYLAYPKVRFRRTEFDFTRDWVQRISSKVLSWRLAAEENSGERALVFADADTLVLQDLSPVFATNDSDIVFTWKPETVPVNTGVLFAQGGEVATRFFALWQERTAAILRTPDLYRQANDPACGFGGADQMSLMQLLGYRRDQTRYTLQSDGLTIRIRGEACSEFNETNSRPLDAAIRVVHYKGGWQPILLQGRPFSRFRPREASWQMLALYLTTFREALAKLNSAAGTAFTARDLGIVVPFYFRENGPRFAPLLYAAWRAREAVKRAALLLRGRPLPDAIPR